MAMFPGASTITKIITCDNNVTVVIIIIIRRRVLSSKCCNSEIGGNKNKRPWFSVASHKFFSVFSPYFFLFD